MRLLFLFSFEIVDFWNESGRIQVTVQAEIAKNLKYLAAEKDCPHILLYGPSGSGKKTLIAGVLRELYGPAAEKIKTENKIWKANVQGGSSSVEVELTSVGSHFHIEMTPADAGLRDRLEILGFCFILSLLLLSSQRKYHT